MEKEADEMLEEVEQFLRLTGMAPSTFGRMATGEAQLVQTMRLGRELKRATRNKLRAFMRSYRQSAA